MAKELIQTRIIPFEEEYYDVIHNHNAIWEKYENKMQRVVYKIAYIKNYDREDLFQQAYIYFVDFCKIYDPYYGGGFIPFDKFLFKNMLIKLRAFIQRHYVKSGREKPTEITEYMPDFGTAQQTTIDIDQVEAEIYNDYIYSLITPRQKQIIDLSMQGYKQQEIGDILDISQSRVSVIRKKTLARLNDILDEEDMTKIKSKI